MSYAQSRTENTNHDISPSRDDIPPTETDSSFVNLFARSRLSKRTFFPTDQEVYLDSSSPLILLNDTTIQAPFRGHYQGPLTTDRRDLSSNNLLEGESPTKRKNSDKKEESFTDRRRRTLKSESRDRRTSKALSNGTSNSRSDVGGTSKGNANDRSEFEPDSSPSKSMIQSDNTPEEQVDVFGIEEKKKEINRFQKWLIKKLDSKWFNLIIAICTIYALFAQDICQAFFNSTTDLGFDIVSLVTIVIFSIEIVLTCYAKREYIGSFFFVLDVLSTASIFLDIGFITGSLFDGGSVESVQEASTSSNQASNMATRAGGIMRVVRLMRLVKLYKQLTHEKAIEQQQVQQQNSNLLHQSTIKSQQSLRKIVPEELASPSILDRKSTLSPSPSPFRKARADSSNLDFGRLATLNVTTAQQTKPRASVITLNALSHNNNDPDGLGEIPRNKSLDQSRISQRPSGMAPMVTGDDLNKHSERHSESQSQSRRARRFSKLSLGSAAVNNNTQNQAPPEVVKESRVGKMLSDLTMKKVIVMVLGLLLFIPMFQSDFWNSSHDSQVYQMGEIGLLINNAVSAKAIEAAIDSFKDQQEKSSGNTPVLLYLSTASKVWYDDKTVDRSKLRDTETQTIYMDTKYDGTLLSIVSMKKTTTFDAKLSLGRTFFICILLTFGAYYFSKDARTLVLQPLERMIEKVNRIARNPLAAKNEKLVIDNQGFENETIHIENAIVKIGGLLALGFGDAGSAIVGQNIAKSGGDINPMLPGKKKAAIYGFCDIRNFTDATEILQEDVMVFVNSIAEVVHSVTDKFAGAANKNIGDAFLLVWKIPDESVTEILDGQLEISTNKSSQNLADCALISFLKIYAKINREPVLLKYRENEKLNARLPNYKVKMGFGLHVGWAIEGAIGSEFKIDASYLSPNVNMASRLEAATKQYGVPLLFSGDLYEMLSDHLQDKSRMIDIVTVKGSIKPIELYTVDMDVEDISIAKDKTNIPKELRKDRQIQKRANIKDLIDAGEVYTLLETDKELVHGLRNYNEEFEKVFSEGFNAYIDGDWSVAKKKFEQCLSIKADDGPTKNLMNFLGEYQFISPEDWDGYHVLTEK